MLNILFRPEAFFGYLAFITSLIGLLPQVYKAYMTKSTTDISFIMLWNYIVCSLAWIMHSWYTQSFVVLFSNIAGLSISLISLLQKCYYDARKI